MVGTYSEGNSSFEYVIRRQVFPTPPSPTTAHLIATIPHSLGQDELKFMSSWLDSGKFQMALKQPYQLARYLDKHLARGNVAAKTSQGMKEKEILNMCTLCELQFLLAAGKEI